MLLMKDFPDYTTVLPYSSIMKLNLFLFLSLRGVAAVTLQVVRHDYYLITTPANWSNAQIYCQKMYTNLAVVQTDDDWQRLNAEAARKGLPTTGWVGLYNRVNSWVWSYQNKLLNVLVTFWGPGQPDNAGGKEICVAMISDGSWLDYPGTDMKPFICYDATLPGFVAVSLQRSWWGSQTYCRTFHTDLASSTNAAENNELQQMVLLQGTSWIGLFRPAWAWVDWTLITTLRWNPGFPNNIDHNDNCASVNNSLLVDRQCNSLFPFFCHTRYTVRKQIMRMQIQGSDNMFNPTVQSAILQQITQKLKVCGIERETTVTWKVQPDGNIFHKKRNL